MNLFSNIPSQLALEQSESVLDAGNLRIERIVSHGQASPDGFWYDQDQHEWVVLLSGAARLRFESSDEPVEMRPGDYVHIPAHSRHRVEWTSASEPTIWLAVHYG
jgi:cupin 2 domain-containing protein